MTIDRLFNLKKYQNTSNRRYNNFEQKIVVRVDKEYVETFSDAFDAQPFRTTKDHSDFAVQASSRYRGDDETIMYDIDARLPDLTAFKGWSVLWSESVY